MRPPPPRSRWCACAELEAELAFWRNYAALTRYSQKRDDLRIPTQRTRPRRRAPQHRTARRR